MYNIHDEPISNVTMRTICVQDKGNLKIIGLSVL